VNTIESRGGANRPFNLLDRANPDMYSFLFNQTGALQVHSTRLYQKRINPGRKDLIPSFSSMLEKVIERSEIG
jgi:hypothetical protein